MLKALNNVGGAASYILSSSLFLDLCWLPRNWQVKSSIVAMARDASMWGECECLNVKIPWANRNKVQSPELPGTRDFKSLPRCTSHRISQGARVQKRLSCKGGFSAWLQSMLWPFLATALSTDMLVQGPYDGEDLQCSLPTSYCHH